MLASSYVWSYIEVVVELFRGCGAVGEAAVVAPRCSTLIAAAADGMVVVGTVEAVRFVTGTLDDCQPLLFRILFEVVATVEVMESFVEFLSENPEFAWDWKWKTSLQVVPPEPRPSLGCFRTVPCSSRGTLFVVVSTGMLRNPGSRPQVLQLVSSAPGYLPCPGAP